MYFPQSSRNFNFTQISTQVGLHGYYSSIIGRQAGVEQVLKHILCDLDASLAMLHKLSEIQGKGYPVLANLTEGPNENPLRT